MMDLERWEQHSRQYRYLRKRETLREVRSTLIALLITAALFATVAFRA